MKIFGLEIRKQKKEPVESFINVQRMGSYSRRTAMSLSAVYRCVNVISESVAQLPLEVFKKDDEGYKKPYLKHSAYSLLREYPNPDMTRFTFLKTLVSSVLLNGNGYAYIDRDNFGNALSIQYIPAGLVNIVYINIEGYAKMRYQVTGFKNLVEPSDMIHVLNFSYDGITGVSTLTHARNTLGIASASEEYAKQFFSEGGNVRGVISVEGRLSPEQRTDIKKAWTINPVDAQMIETRQFNVVDICRFFGVSPVKAFDLTKSSYSTVEATQLSFLTDTLAPMLENLELEFKRKVFRPSERSYVEVQFDTSNLLRADKAAQATWMKTMYEMAGMTPNEARRMNNMEKVPNGDQPLVNNAMVPLEYVANKKFETGKEKS